MLSRLATLARGSGHLWFLGCFAAWLMVYAINGRPESDNGLIFLLVVGSIVIPAAFLYTVAWLLDGTKPGRFWLLAGQRFGGLFFLLLIAVLVYRFAVEGTWRDWPVVSKIAATTSTKKWPTLYGDKAALSKAIQPGRPGTPQLNFANVEDGQAWLEEMSRRLSADVDSQELRVHLLVTVHYEATRAGLDPQLVLALVDVLSAFKKYAVSPSGARGYMQVAPAWVAQLGTKDDNLFHVRTNLRYGCVVLRHYLDEHGGDLSRALVAYRNQTLGRPDAVDADSPSFPNAVLERWRTRWAYRGRLA